MTPHLAAVLARMVEAALAAEDGVASGGNIADRGAPARRRPVALERPKGHTAKEVAS